MTAAIPDELMYRAGAVVADICGDAHSDAQLITMLEVDAMAEHIARAILSERNRATEAERERCADIADTIEQPGIPGTKEWLALGNFAGVIRDAIRQPTGE